MPPTTVLIIGAGPAGLTAALEIVRTTNWRVLVLEGSPQVGGICSTFDYRGNKIDIGGHRFFTKSRRVLDFWLDLLPLQKLPDPEVLRIPLPAGRAGAWGPDPEREDAVMLLRVRRSRIYYLRRFFDYPVTLSLRTVRNLGWVRTVRSGLTYGMRLAFPRRPESTLEDFFINRFGDDLYEMFFRSYTEKVWGVPCKEIPADWGRQRIKGLSIRKALAHAAVRAWPLGSARRSASVETSLIEQFLYPKFGPGQLWEAAAGRVERAGGRILMNRRVVRFERVGTRVTRVWTRREPDGEMESHAADVVLSSMAVRDFIGAFGEVPEDVGDIARRLPYRDFITVGLLYAAPKPGDGTALLDNWIYLQEPDVMAGRLQIFNNWSPYLVRDPARRWMGLEYFCTEGDPLWARPDSGMLDLAADEMARLGLARRPDLLDGTVLRVRKAYPAYFGSYEGFPVVREYLQSLENVIPIGRNGLHRYNNQDHSMLTALRAVDNLREGRTDHSNVWTVNTEHDYHEEMGESPPGG